MTIEEVIAKWNSQWRYDFWWRTRYEVAFGSPEHRAANQVDIYFEYVENRMYQEAVEKFKVDEEKQKKFKETGIWLNPDEKVTDDAWDKLDLSLLSKNNNKK
jgi:hypothetical protein